MISVGLDLSLTHTGYAVIKDGKVVSSGVIKSKPSGDKPLDEIKRIKDIVQKIDEKLAEHCSQNSRNAPVIADIVVIEGLAFMARNSSALVQLSGLNYMVRDMLLGSQVPFLIVAPSSLKKFITGKGNGEKDLMMMTVFKEYGFESMDNNECDAYSLAVCGLALLGSPIKKLTKPQLEVVEILKKQL